MKQRITVKELNKLTDVQKQKIWEWWKPQRGDFALAWRIDRNDIPFDHVDIFIGDSTEWDKNSESYFTYDAPETYDNDGSCDYYRKDNMLPLLSIGQMIQLINEKKPLKSISKARFDKWTVNIDTATLGYKDELCDSLWETVTRIL